MTPGAGHASTTGIPTLDYYISYNPFEPLNAQDYYSETLVTFSDFSNYYKVLFHQIQSVALFHSSISNKDMWNSIIYV